MKDRCKCGAWSALDHEACPKCGERDLDQWEREHERAKAEFYASKDQLSDDERGI
jgi:hypothetical protein